MILLLVKYQKAAAWFLFSIFYLSIALPSYARTRNDDDYYRNYYAPINTREKINSIPASPEINNTVKKAAINLSKKISVTRTRHYNHPTIGGPSQPEMASFKSVGTDKMVNLFTGDFSYNIPLLDVGGYPVNIFYDGNITMEQEASWVGLGWNINPGTINRNMRGVPDDFDGTDTLVEQQRMKANKTFGFSMGADAEECGLGIFNVGAGISVGLSINNYLGPAFDFDPKGSIGISCSRNAGSEKISPGITAGLSADFNSRTGLTLSPSVSLTAQASKNDQNATFGYGVSTNYNSRSGIAALQEGEQVSFSRSEASVSGVGPGTEDAELSFGHSTTISFAKPSYSPTIRMPLTNTAYSGHIEIGGSPGYGFFADGDLEAYEQKSEVASGDITQKKPLVGYLYYQQAVNNEDAIMDFTRFNDKEVLQNTPIVSAPQYTYDIFSIQGEGTGGSIRAYRNDVGYVRDNSTISHDNSNSFGLDIGIFLHYGVNINTISTPTHSGEWVTGNMLHDAVPFTTANGVHENVYFRNPGECSVLNAGQYANIGGTDLVRFQLSGSASNPMILPSLQHFAYDGTPLNITSQIKTSLSDPRQKRSQVVSFLTADEASIVGLDKAIKSYNKDVILDPNNNLNYVTIPRTGGYRKGHHISEIDVTEATGKRYVYGIPVYNICEKDFTFSVNQGLGPDADKVAVDASQNWMDAGQSHLLFDDSRADGYVEIKQTPAYAHSFLLSGVLSPDYVDLTGDGITDDDMGNAVKFNYTRIIDNSTADGWAVHKWRTPLTNGDTANFNGGNRSETKDDKGIVNYGLRESWYMHSIESKSMIAIFTLKDRQDGKGAVNEDGGVNGSDNSFKRLDRIDLYNKADLKKNGLAKAKPIKTVHFWYSYNLCKGTPDNIDKTSGKLTLDSISFTFNGQNRANKNKYAFSYTNTDGTGNPNYIFNGSDRWGNYKPGSMNPSGMSNLVYPYAIQDAAQKATIDKNAGAWSLKKILLPSGGQLEVNYETDDYAYVQNLRATDMTQILGFGSSPTGGYSNRLYTVSGLGTITDNNVVFMKVPVACTSDADVNQRYIKGMGQLNQLAFKLWVRMPNDYEYLTCYATIQNSGLSSSDPTGHTIWVSLNSVDGVGPLTLTTIEYLRQQLPDQAFPGYDLLADPVLSQLGTAFMSFLTSFRDAFRNPLNYLRSDENMAKLVDVSKSFVRLDDPDGFKYGGGQRVKSIVLKDNWQPMTGQYTSMYGQKYDYTTTEVFNGATRTISSGVASYEPSIGGEENPFQTIQQVEDNLPLGPASYGAIENPVLDAFFPAPSVGYSKVTVSSLNNNTDTSQHTRSGVGKQVTEYYTSKDYPVIYSNTSLDPSSDLEEHVNSTTNFFNKYAYDYKNLSQGFLVINNDMNGKMKTQSSYAENDDVTPVNYTEDHYSNTGANGMNDKFSFVNGQTGAITQGNTGVDVELMNDAREFSVNSSSQEWQINIDIFEVPWPLPIPFPWPVYGNTENVYRAVTSTKVVSYHSILDSVVVIDRGSKTTAKNLLYDGETGSLVVSKVNNEFNQPVYSTTYPAYWAYSGMGPAYKNIDAVYSGVNFSQGLIISGFDQSIFESGDELYLTAGSGKSAGCVPESPTVSKIWAYDTTKNSSSLTDIAPHLVFIDSAGNPYTKNGVTFKIVRSGKRNMLDEDVQTITSLNSPIVTNGSIQQLSIDASKVINASASEYNEKWQIDPDEIQTFSTSSNVCTQTQTLLPACGGLYLEQLINPYCKGLLGSYKAFKGLVFYGNRTESDPTIATNLSKNGFIKNFKSYWDFNTKNLVPNAPNSNWVWKNMTTKINSRSLELETKDALNIYTAAQYGYNKNLPVAITNNARSSESGYDGFEDQAYNETIDPNTTESANNCSQLHFFDMNKMYPTQVLNTDNMNFTAHTGKYVLGIVPGNNTMTFPVTTAPLDTFSMALNPYTPNINSLINLGGNIIDADYKDANGHWESFNRSYLGNSGLQSYLQTTPFTNNAGGTGYSMLLTDNLGDNGAIGGERNSNTCPAPGYRYNPYTNFVASLTIDLGEYIYIGTPGNYNITAIDGSDFHPITNPTNIPCNFFNTQYEHFGINVTLSPLNGGSNPITISTNSNPYQGTYAGDMIKGIQNNFTYYLCKGFYKVNCAVDNSYNTMVFGDYGLRHYLISYNLTNPSGPAPIGYKDLTTISGCTTTVPIPATPQMLNEQFSIPSNKQMVFSAWVHEDCGNPATGVPCTAATFSGSKVNLQFNDGASTKATFVAAGPIIDGWQRYEGFFTAPPGATSMTMTIANSSSSMIYFDDIRIHPFNANMKSYVYDPISQRLVAQLDENNYATFYEYDEDGTLVRTKAETIQGIKTISETRSATQKNITTVQ